MNKSLEKGSNENCYINYRSVWDPIAGGSTVAPWSLMEPATVSRYLLRSRRLFKATPEVGGNGIGAAKSKRGATSLGDGAVLTAETLFACTVRGRGIYWPS